MRGEIEARLKKYDDILQRRNAQLLSENIDYTDETPSPEAAAPLQLRMEDKSAKIAELASLLPDERREAFRAKVTARYSPRRQGSLRLREHGRDDGPSGAHGAAGKRRALHNEPVRQCSPLHKKTQEVTRRNWSEVELSNQELIDEANKLVGSYKSQMAGGVKFTQEELEPYRLAKSLLAAVERRQKGIQPRKVRRIADFGMG